MHHVIAELLLGPWAILPERLAFITALLRSAGGQSARPDPATQARIHATASAERHTLAGHDAIAVLPFHGVAVQRADELGEALGLLSLTRFAQNFRAALSDDSVAGILLDVDSPGGSVYGITELAGEVWGARGRKPVFAVANSLAASGAYWIASSAGEFYVTPGGEVGSIGVFAAHQDMSQALEKAGVKTTLVSAGRYKLDGHPAQPLGADARRHVQARVDAYYDTFVRGVARNRAVDPATVRNGFGQGRVLSAQAAKGEGMVDGVASLNEVLAIMVQRIRQGKAANTSRVREIAALARPPSSGSSRAVMARRAAARQRVIQLLSL